MESLNGSPTTVIALIAFIITGSFGLFVTLIGFLKYLIDKMSEKMDNHSKAFNELTGAIREMLTRMDIVVDAVIMKNNIPPPPAVPA